MVTMVEHTSTVDRPTLRERHPLVAQLARYVVAGGVGTLVNALVYLLLRTWWDLLPANLVALVLSTLVSTEVNRRFTFSGEEGQPWRAHVQTVGMVAFYAVYSTAVLLALTAIVDRPTPLLESVTVAAASVLGGAARFLLLRFWVFDPEPSTSRGPDATAPAPGARIAAFWRGHHRAVVRVTVAFLAGTALLLTSAGACESGTADPGSTQTGY
ncbi:MAG: GtrA family protein [Pseudonocardia sp.]|nr:GtrA family protein [Pseudonocardia sp.]